jgi:hypothetical protein
MLALKREERYIVHQVSSDMNLTETRLRNSSVTRLLGFSNLILSLADLQGRRYSARHSFHH